VKATSAVSSGRGRFQGVKQSIVFNWTKYATAIPCCVVLVGLPIVFELGRPLSLACFILGGLAGWWTIASVVAAYWVFDRAGIYELRWLDQARIGSARRWANIHAGLDEFSSLLERRLGCEPVAVLDIYDPERMTEPAIARARGVHPAHARTVRADHAALPIPDGSCDAVFVIFAAHELRTRADRAAFFGEVRRCLAPGGAAVVLEFVRDMPNFIAFGPGFRHFFSRRTWSEAFADSGLSGSRERRLTPLVRMFALRPG
jgi:SAM-dependent methyltransferase